MAAGIVALILRLLPYILQVVGLGMLLWFGWQTGSAIVGGVQQAAPGIGAAIGSIGMMFSLLPVMFMFMMMMSMMTMMLKLIE